LLKGMRIPNPYPLVPASEKFKPWCFRTFGWLSFKTSSLIFRPVVEGYTYTLSLTPGFQLQKSSNRVSNKNTGFVSCYHCCLVLLGFWWVWWWPIHSQASNKDPSSSCPPLPTCVCPTHLYNTVFICRRKEETRIRTNLCFSLCM
jgi:hypothetical protein